MNHSSDLEILPFPVRWCIFLSKRALAKDIDGKRKKGRPKRKWMDVVKGDVRKLEYEQDDALDRN